MLPYSLAEMRVIPVLDLKGGLAVHAVRGERARYAPVQSVLAPSSDPVVLARAFLAKLGCRDCYVADLDAIQGIGNHAAVVRALVGLGLHVWLDAGISTAADASRVLDWGPAHVIAGTETLTSLDNLSQIVAGIPPGPPLQVPARQAAADPARSGRCVLSLDLRDGRLLGGSTAVEGFDAVQLAALGWAAGIRTFIVLDLGRVGTGGGVQTNTAMKLRAALPAAEIIVGGGVRDTADMRELARLGFDGVLVATALHTGAITSVTLSEPD
jgi:phosphoribosylformimino-5-aminoimidazole carboxamide ribotide isomerase